MSTESKIVIELGHIDQRENGKIDLPKTSVENEILPLMSDDLQNKVRAGVKKLEVVLVNDEDGRKFSLSFSCDLGTFFLKKFRSVAETYHLCAGYLVEFYPKTFQNRKLVIGFTFSSRSETSGRHRK
ncbi:putative DNA-binding pseudobarrel domain superfamily [Helianthus anomalus]